MSRKPPPRYKDVAELTTAEHLERIRTGRVPETDAYIDYRNQVLRDAGLEPDDAPPKATADMSADELEGLSTDDHLRRIRRERT